MKRIAVIPGSFDPPTWGHIALFNQTKSLFDEVYVMIGYNLKKPQSFLTIDDRLSLLKEENAEKWDGATIRFCEKVGAGWIVRSFRSVTDFEYERAIAAVNSKLNFAIQTVFLSLPENLQAVSSSTVRELWELGLIEELHQFVPDNVFDLLKWKWKMKHDDSRQS